MAVGDLYSGRICAGDLKNSGYSCVSAQAGAMPDTLEDQTGETHMPWNPEEFWSLEGIGIMDSATISDDDKAIQMFEATISRKGQRYEVGWPWKPGQWNLANNYGISLGRLKALIKRLSENESLYEKYDEIVRQQGSLGIVERVGDNEDWKTRGRIYYIPHQPVLSLNTFASRRARAVDSEVVELQVALRDGSKKTIQANTVPYLTKELKCRTGCTNGKYGERGDPTEQQVVHDLLIGADCLREFLDGIGIEKLPDGLFRIPTTVGDLYSGRISTGDLKNSGYSCMSAQVGATPDTLEDRVGEKHMPRNPEEFWSLEGIGMMVSATMSDDDKATQMFEATISRKGQ
ncbi:unnamed protein product [Toxocara canis]|uniref:Terminase n=1 Tax=Toxocara canis TaxID=6265 RepID=A0A183U5M6_TOXCA|nr:unnamed protein product [Toxocara canis]